MGQGRIVWVVSMVHAVYGQQPVGVYESKLMADVMVARYPGGRVTPVQAYPPVSS